MLDLDVYARRIVLLEVSLDFLDQFGVMRPILVQPENCGVWVARARFTASLTQSRIGASFIWRAPPNVTFFDLMLEEDLAGGIEDANGAFRRDLERLVVGTVFLLLFAPSARHLARCPWCADRRLHVSCKNR